MQPLGPFGLIAEERGQARLLGGQPRPTPGTSSARPPRGPLGGGQVEQSLQRGVHQRAARSGYVGGSGSRSITRNRYSSGHVMKSAARDGDSAGPVARWPGSVSAVPGNTSMPLFFHS